MSNDVRRIDVKVGYSCNNNCMHCVIADRRGVYADRSTEEVKTILREARADYNDVVLTGGEITIRKDCLEIIRYARELDFMINIQSNGRMFAYKSFCEKVLDAARGGHLSFTLALLSSEEEVHNTITRTNSYKHIVKGIQNLVEMGQQVNINTVVSKMNYTTLPALALMLVALRVSSYQYAFVHACGNAEKFIDQILPRKSEVAPYIKKGLQIGIDNNIRCFVEAFPMCFLRGGYEGYITEKYMPHMVKLVDQPHVVDDFTTRRKTVEKVKGPECHRCIYFEFCEGPWFQYPAYYGWDEFIPVE